MRSDTDILLRSYVFDTGEYRRGAVLIPVEVFGGVGGAVRHVVEGSIELVIAGVALLDRDDWGYIDSWWNRLLDAAEALVRGQPFTGPLDGKALSLYFDPVPNTRRTRIRIVPSREILGYPREAIAHTPTLAGAILDAAEVFAGRVPRVAMHHDLPGRVAIVRSLRVP